MTDAVTASATQINLDNGTHINIQNNVTININELESKLSVASDAIPDSSQSPVY